MKIIKQGQPPEEKIYKGTCQNCGTVFEFCQGEARIESFRNESCLIISCPLEKCGQQVCVDYL